MSNLEEILAQPYAVRLVWDDDEPGVFAELPELPGCMSQGRDMADALSMLRDAQRVYVQVALYKCLPIPLPAGVRSPRPGGDKQKS